MRWRLGLDLGTNSLGWAALRLDENNRPCGVIAMGSRIFGAGRDSKSNEPLAVARRMARAMRRQRDRFKRRQAALLKHLMADGLFPEDLTQRNALALLDPYALRAKALDGKISLHELGRALFHLNQRRGFKSNRKTDRGANEQETGAIKIGVSRLRLQMEQTGARTLGEFLHNRRAAAADANSIPSVRTRIRPETGENAKGNGYDFYPERSLLQDEFEAIWQAQQPHHPSALTETTRKRLYEIIFHQRPLREAKPGRCTLLTTEDRLPKAHPLFQKRRLLEELNALEILRPGQEPEKLTPEQRDKLLLAFSGRKDMTFTAMAKTLKLDSQSRFNKDTGGRDKLLGDEVSAQMAGKGRFGPRWVTFSTDQQWEIVQQQQALETEAEAAEFCTMLETRYGLTAEQALSVAGARLPAGYGRIGLTASTKIIDALLNGRNADGRVLVYSEAVASALGHHSDLRTGEVHVDEKGNPALPYYGVVLERHIVPGTADPAEKDDAARIGRLTNPTVHIGLNQLRRVVNTLIRAYGMPTEMALELARDLKLTEDEKKERNKENNTNRIAAEKRSRKLEELRQADNGGNRALLKLWEELNPENALDRRCIYTGQQISIDMLFSDRVEVDHILPFAATLDDTNANKIVCTREANREKRRRSPFDAWGHTAGWTDIAQRAMRLPHNKQWRFQPDAMQRFADESGFQNRHLVDTQYLGRLARDYLSAMYPEKGEGSSRVWVSPGRMTEMVRRKLGLNDLLPDHNFGGGADQPKNRLDHRHHAIDAAVVAVIDRGMLQAISRASGQDGAEGRERIMIPEPWNGFRDDLRKAVGRVVTAHRVDHGTTSKAGLKPGRDQTAGQLHNDTAYGLTGEKKGDKDLVVRRVALSSFAKPEALDAIRDTVLRQALTAFTAGYSGQSFPARIASFPAEGPAVFRGIRRARVVEALNVIPIRDEAGRIYKGYKGDSNHSYTVWQLPDGKWRCQVVSTFAAHQTHVTERPHPAAAKVLVLHIGDMLAIERTHGERELVRVVKFSEKQLALAAPNEAGSLKARDADKADPFKYIYPSPNTLKSWRARQVRVDEIGRVQDPGFPARKTVRRTREPV